MNAVLRKAGPVSPPRAEAADTLVYGLGSTGLSVARYLAGRGVDAVYLDTRSAPPGLAALESLLPEAEVLIDSLPEERIERLRRAIVSPGIPETDRHLKRLREAGIDIVSDIELFVDAAAADYVAVTGSNGKSTVTTLIAGMCEAAGLRVLAGGNLGRPALDLLAEDPPDLYVLELSSFQLARTRYLPARVAVLLNVSADHLDWHGSEAEYRAAKQRIFDQAKAAVVNRGDPRLAERLHADLPRISFGLDAPPEGHYGVTSRGDAEYLARGERRILRCDEVAMTGRHNLANALAAMAAGELAGLPQAAMCDTLRGFTGLPHRMQSVSELDGVRYIDDSKATNVAAAVAAVQSVDGPVVLLAGGQGKGGDFEALAAEIAGRLRAVIVFGEDAPGLEAAFDRRAPVCRVDDLAAAVTEARAMAVPGDTVLLAPACASFDQFSDYRERGDAFAAAVQGLDR